MKSLVWLQSTPIIPASTGQRLDADAYLENLSQLLFPMNATERVMCMLAAYFDESGTHADSPVICMAGYIAKASQWVEFSSNWQEVLDRYGIDCFHMSQYESRKGVFAMLDNRQRVDLITSLATMINLRVETSIIAAFPLADYHEVIAKRHGDKIVGPYFFCAMLVMVMVKRWAAGKSHTEPIAYCFEPGAVHYRQFRHACEDALKNRAFAAE